VICVRIRLCLHVPANMATHRNEKAPRAIPTAYFIEPAVSSHTVCMLPLKALVRRLQEVPVIKKNTYRCVEESLVFDIHLTLQRST
jgi:hypothetical protein